MPRRSPASSTVGRPPFRKRATSPSSASRSASTSSGGATTPAPVSRISSAAAPSGGTAARIGRSAARYSKTFPESTPLPRPPASGIRSSSASESRCSSSAAARRVRDQLEPVAEARASPPTRGRPSGSRRRSARRRPWPDSASAVRNGRGSRLPKKLPVCVIRKRSPGVYSSPAKSSKSQPFEIVATRPRGSKPRASSAIASETQVIASAERATSCATPSLDLLLRADGEAARRGGAGARRASRAGRRPTSRRSRACTAAPTRWTELGGEVVSTTSIPSLPRDPDRGRDRGQVPAHVLVRDEQPPRGQLREHERAAEALLAVQLLGGLAPLRPEVARAVHPGLGRRAQVGVRVDPLRVVRREHVRLDPERGQVLRELERPLDAAAAGRREVERDEQQLHDVDASGLMLRSGRIEPVEREALVAVDDGELRVEVEAVAVDDEPVGAGGAAGSRGRRSGRTRGSRRRRSYGRFSSVSATWAGGAAAT